jgi:hypothetical protein
MANLPTIQAISIDIKSRNQVIGLMFVTPEEYVVEAVVQFHELPILLRAKNAGSPIIIEHKRGGVFGTLVDGSDGQYFMTTDRLRITTRARAYIENIEESIYKIEMKLPTICGVATIVEWRKGWVVKCIAVPSNASAFMALAGELEIVPSIDGAFILEMGIL